MTNVTLRFIGLGYDDKYQAYVQIFDEYDNIICKEYTFNNILNVKLENKKYYHLIATNQNEKIDTILYINKCFYTLIFPSAYYQIPSRRDEKTVTLLLTDYNYYGLPIMKGEIILWQKP